MRVEHGVAPFALSGSCVGRCRAVPYPDTDQTHACACHAHNHRVSLTHTHTYPLLQLSQCPHIYKHMLGGMCAPHLQVHMVVEPQEALVQLLR